MPQHEYRQTPNCCMLAHASMACHAKLGIQSNPGSRACYVARQHATIRMCKTTKVRAIRTSRFLFVSFYVAEASNFDSQATPCSRCVKAFPWTIMCQKVQQLLCCVYCGACIRAEAQLEQQTKLSRKRVSCGEVHNHNVSFQSVRYSTLLQPYEKSQKYLTKET